jgi:low temperature requirement protein LtrA
MKGTGYFSGLLRGRDGSTGPRVTTVELFFDLVYVFAVTQLSHFLLEHLTLRGALETLILFLAVWWAWNYTAWATNWIDPDRPKVRVLMLVLMLISLIMSSKIPRAFSDEALGFAIAYVLLQTVRSAFVVMALKGQRMARNYAQLLARSGIAGVVWIVGALAHGDARLLLWVVALAIDYAAPIHGFVLPVVGRTPTQDWTLAGGHLAERNQLFVLIALGESILAIGATFSALTAHASIVIAFIVGFALTASLWWLYFVREAEEGARTIAASGDPTRVGRAAYAYGHGVMVAGIIVTAVAIDLTIDHPTGSTTTAEAAVILGGPALYLVGNAIFNLALSSRLPWSRIIGIGALALLIPLALATGPLLLSIAATIVIMVLAAVSGSPHTDREEVPETQSKPVA